MAYYFVRRTPQLGFSLSSVAKRLSLNPVTQIKNAISDTKKVASTAKNLTTAAASNTWDLTKKATNLAINTTKRTISNPLSITNVISNVKDTASLVKSAATTPVTSTVTAVKKSLSDDKAANSQTVAQQQAAAAAAAKAASAASAKQAQQIAAAKKKQQEEVAAAAERAVKAMRDASANKSRFALDTVKKGSGASSKIGRYVDKGSIAEKIPAEFNHDYTTVNKEELQKLVEAANMATNTAAAEEQTNYLPEVQVKSDFSKYLLIGGAVVLGIYLLRGKN